MKRWAVFDFRNAVRWGRQMLAWVLLVLPGVIRADIVAAEKRPMAVDVRITQLQEGQLFYRLSGGKEINRPIEQITYLQITGWDLFNQAEKHFRNGNYRQATPLYVQTLAAFAGEKSGNEHELDRQLLVHCRLLRSCDAQGDFDGAVQSYLHVIERMPRAAATLQPTRIPAAGSTFLVSAGKKVDEFLSRHPTDEVGLAIMRWRSTWAGASPATAPAGDSSKPTPVVPVDPQETTKAPAETRPDLDRRLNTIRQQIESEHPTQSLAAIEQLQQEPVEAIAAIRAELFYLQGRALLKQATSATDESATAIRERAELAFMRVVVHFPEHAAAAECLYQVAQLEREAGRTLQAAGLRTELIRKYPQTVWASHANTNPSSQSTTQP